MITRLYVHNLRCLENFELLLGALHATLLLGRNGTGKSTIGHVLELLQSAARGTNRVGDLIQPSDLTQGRMTVPARIEIDADVAGRAYSYAIAFEYPDGFRELRVCEEQLSADGQQILTRDRAQVTLHRPEQARGASFLVDWHLIALPIVQAARPDDPLALFRSWLADILVIRPVPSLATGEARGQARWPDPELVDIGAWFARVVGAAPSAYAGISEFLSRAMPDFREIRNPNQGGDYTRLELHFGTADRDMVVPFKDLSDGEKYLVFLAVMLAAKAAQADLVCYWDEPDNFLAPAEVSPSLIALRAAFRDRGQLIVTSHNPEVVRRFSDDNTLIFYRRTRLEPTQAALVSDLRAQGKLSGDLVDALLLDDLPQ